MNILNTFAITFTGLKSGTHKYDYLVEHSFLKEFKQSPVQEGRVWVNVLLTKEETLMVFEFTIKGTVNVICDRCLEPFDQPIEGEQRLIVKFGDTTFEETDEVLVLSRGEHEINLAQVIYEFILLAIPLKLVHPDTEDGEFGCSPEALEAINRFAFPEHSEAPDPRWDALKKLKK